MNDMYRENVLDHAKNMRNKGLLDPNDFDHTEHNPLCGDKLHLTLRVEDGIIREVGWDGSGCAVSQASASMLGETLIGMSLDEATHLNKQFVLDLIGFPLTMNRVKCALLSLKTLLVGAAGTARWEQVEDEA
jgi:nitrogen fixation NifU-like protein